MRRISIHIRSKRNPELHIPGYMVMHELGTEILTFFSTKKFRHEEELEVTAEIHGSMKKYELELAQCNEQISSGRVMTSIPVEGAPLPTRTFYRCFAKVLSLVSLEDGVPKETTESTAQPTLAAVPEVSMNEVQVPVMPDAPAAEAAPIEEQKAA